MRNIIVVGASTGGVEALKVFASGLPPDLNAAVFVVLHIGMGIRGQSLLPEILSQAGCLPAGTPKDRDSIQNGRIYVAPPDFHLVVEPDCIRLSHGPKENSTRPAINPLFRSAADAYGASVTGIILTGELDDGVAGLAEVKRCGGIAIVEDPESAISSSMPRNAVERVNVDYIVPLPEIAGLAADIYAKDRIGLRQEKLMEKKLTGLTCPECRGPLSEEKQGRITEYSWRVGHRYSPLAMESEHRNTVERSLWASVVALEEAADISERMASELGPESLQMARRTREQASILKQMLGEGSE